MYFFFWFCKDLYYREYLVVIESTKDLILIKVKSIRDSCGHFLRTETGITNTHLPCKRWRKTIVLTCFSFFLFQDLQVKITAKHSSIN